MAASVIARLDSSVYAMLKDDLIKGVSSDAGTQRAKDAMKEQNANGMHQYQEIGKYYKSDKTEDLDLID